MSELEKLISKYPPDFVAEIPEEDLEDVLGDIERKLRRAKQLGIIKDED